MKQNLWIYHLLALLTNVVWGSTFISTKIILTNGLTAAQVFFFRFVIAYIGLCLIQLARRGKGKRMRLFCDNWKDEGKMVLAAMTGGSIFFWLQNTGMIYAEASLVSFLVCVAPLITALLALFGPKGERPSRLLWWGAVVALVGVYLIVTGNGGDLAMGTNRLLGGSLAFLAAVLWAVYQMICKPLSKKYGTLMLTRKVFGYGVVTIFPLILWEGNVDWNKFCDPRIGGNLLYLGIMASLVCFWVWSRVMQELGGVVSSNYLYVPPLVASLFSYFILGERLTPLMLLGGMLILAGVSLAIIPQRRAKR